MTSALHKVFAGFVRRTWLVTLVAIVVCGGFTANAVDAFTAEPPAPPTTPPVARKVSPPARPLARNPDVLVERNIFCSTCTPEPRPGPSNAYSGHPAVLIATSGGIAATVRVVPTEVQGAWLLDETIPGVGRITRIGGTSIEVVDEHGHSKELSLLPEPAAGSGAATPTPAAESPFADRVKKLSDGSYEVDRNIVRELVASGGKDAGARVMPAMSHGAVQGLKFYAIRPTSIAAAIGLKSGDLLSAIDGDPIKNLNQVLDLYSKLDKLSGIELQGTRGGKPLAIQLRFR